AAQRVAIFIIAALLASLSGWLYAHMQRFVNPTPFGLNIGIEYLFMAVIGGVGHVWGAVLGAGIVTMLKQWLQDWLPVLFGSAGNFETIVFGVLLVLVLQRTPKGLWPSIARWSYRWLPLEQAHPGIDENAKPLALQPLPERGSVVLDAQALTKKFG